MSGLLATAIVGFGLRLVRGRSLVPRPAARMSPFICCPLSDVVSAERIAPGVHGPYAADHTACVHEPRSRGLGVVASGATRQAMTLSGRRSAGVPTVSGERGRCQHGRMTSSEITLRVVRSDDGVEAIGW